ncbi:MAG: RDD family protein [Agathobacter sp.]|nr:RDD family protein [Agathobacter sp.]
MIYDLQKASMWKRASAFLFDFIILGIVVVGLATLMSSVLGYDKYNNDMNAAYDKYEKQYGVEFEITYEEYESKSEEDKANWDAAYAALIADKEAIYAYNMVFNLSILIATFGILFAFIILEFVIPNILGNGQTLGKKIFGLGVMRTDGIKVTAPLMFIRTILGKFTIETMIPVLIIMMVFFNAIGIVGPIIIGLILLVQIILMIATHTNSMIHDVLAKTVVIDVASQMIFDSEADLIAYKEKVHAEQVARQTY